MTFVIERYRFILKLNRSGELAQAVDIVMVQAKIIYILRIKVNKLFSFYSSRNFLNEIEDMFYLYSVSIESKKTLKVWETSKRESVNTWRAIDPLSIEG